MIGVQLIHVCGHDGYHIVPYALMKRRDEFYQWLEARPCPQCEKPKKGRKK
jgi:hypothetical protein